MENLLKSFLSCLLRNWKTEACSLPWITSRLSVENWMIQKCRSLFLSWALTASRCVWIRTGPSAATRLEPLVKRKASPNHRGHPRDCDQPRSFLLRWVLSSSPMYYFNHTQSELHDGTLEVQAMLTWHLSPQLDMRLCSPVKSSTLLFPCP